MERYLVRLRNAKGYAPKDARSLASQIRELLGSRDSIGNLRVATSALEFDLFALDKKQLDERLGLLESRISRVDNVKLLDKLPRQLSKQEVLREGFDLFNQERYWEAHEVLEQAWQPAKGAERDTVQGIILTAAALVHHQKDRDAVSLGMLEKALSKLGEENAYEGINLASLRREIREMLRTRVPKVVRLSQVSPAG